MEREVIVSIQKETRPPSSFRKNKHHFLQLTVIVDYLVNFFGRRRKKKVERKDKKGKKKYEWSK